MKFDMKYLKIKNHRKRRRRKRKKETIKNQTSQYRTEAHKITTNPFQE
jgi:hypothetical protein